MAGGKVSTRQKMINMMYLVLTALLALNVSAEILKAFYLVEVSMEKSGENIDKKNTDIMDQFKFSMANFPEKTKPFYDKALIAEKETKEFVTFVEGLKKDFEAGTGGRQPDGQLEGSKDMDYHPNVLINEGKGVELKQKINGLREKLASLLDAEDKKTFKSDLIAEDEPGSIETWEVALFEHTPLAAVMAILAKIQNDAKNSEADVLSKLARSITKADQTFSNLEAKVIPSSTYVMLGNEYKADIFLAAYDAKVDNPVYVNGEKLPVEGGMGKYVSRPNTEGEIKYKGKIQVKDPTGKLKDYEFEQSYFAFKPAATISATKMNVLYVGVDNPISVSVPGVRPEDVVVTASAGSLSGSKGNYIIRVPAGQRETTISASAKVKDKTVPMGSMKYRIRPLPKPVVQFGQINTPTATAANIKATNVIYASLGEGFAFEGISYTVTQYSFMHVPKRGVPTPVTVKGSPFVNPQIKGLYAKLAPGDQIIIYDVKAKGPAGEVMLTTSVLLTVR